jgi:hypothetical protein
MAIGRGHLIALAATAFSVGPEIKSINGEQAARVFSTHFSPNKKGWR